MSKRIIVAIDGPAGSGKSTIAKRVAARLGFTYIDTGAMYRAIGLSAIRTGVDFTDDQHLGETARFVDLEFRDAGTRLLMAGEDISEAIRTPQISEAASKVSAVSAVRRALVDKQREMAARTSVVMEGRDIGTVVFPEAELKFFLDANAQVRTERRLKELAAKGKQVNAGEVLSEIGERDKRDTTRADSPLVQAPDAIYIDTSGMTLEQVEERILKIIRDKTSNGKEALR